MFPFDDFIMCWTHTQCTCMQTRFLLYVLWYNEYQTKNRKVDIIERLWNRNIILCSDSGASGSWSYYFNSLMLVTNIYNNKRFLLKEFVTNSRRMKLLIHTLDTYVWHASHTRMYIYICIYIYVYIKMYKLRLRYHWCLFPMVQLTI